MPLFRPNIIGKLYRKAGLTEFGDVLTGRETPFACAVLEMNFQVAQSSVRADRSASRANAAELIGNATLLVLPGLNLAVGDRLEVAGQHMTVNHSTPMLSLGGTIDHYQVLCDVWARQ